MRLTIVEGVCQGHARCASLVPELFDVDENGYGVVLPGGEHVAGDDERVRLAIDNCPEQAIRLEPEAT